MVSLRIDKDLYYAPRILLSKLIGIEVYYAFVKDEKVRYNRSGF